LARAYATAILGCVLFVGCGDSGLPTTKVTGLVTFDGAPPPKPGNISFSLVQGTGTEGLPYRPGGSAFGTDGEFTVTSFEKGDGLLPGTYKVQITCLAAPPSQGPLAQLSYVPLDWTPEDLVITSGERSIEVNYDVPMSKKVRK
ncbi:MAG: hypothetical protein KDA37_03695, partial [Planctomycetales bacterium]|nr:hypothetical protein [Planctomycetales bacterium]